MLEVPKDLNTFRIMAPPQKRVIAKYLIAMPTHLIYLDILFYVTTALFFKGAND